MKTKSRTRASGLAGLIILATVVLMMVAQTAQAALVQSTGAGSGTSPGPVGPPSERLNLAQVHPNVVAAVVTDQVAAAPTEPAVKPVAPGPYDVTQSGPSRYSLSNGGPGSGGSITDFSANTPSSPSTTVWIAVAGLAGGLLIVAWAFARGRIRRRDPDFSCEATLMGC